MSLSSKTLERLVALGCSSDQLEVASWLESRRGSAGYVDAIITGLEASDRLATLPKFIEDFAAGMAAIDASNSAKTRPSVASLAGPLQRWGYDGPITPRLAERDWWPLRNHVIRSAGGVCHYCGDTPAQMCADHVVPLSRGGTNDITNLVACCLPCNSSKSDRLLSEWEGRYR